MLEISTSGYINLKAIRVPLRAPVSRVSGFRVPAKGSFKVRKDQDPVHSTVDDINPAVLKKVEYTIIPIV